MTDNLVRTTTPTGPRPSSIATSVSVSISDRMSGMSAGSSSALSSARNSVSVIPSGTPTTTISTIAMQSGQTKIVIALLQSKEWLQLKILNMEPHVTELGSTFKEASEMLAVHDDVLKKLQSKQSPVEELLRQADQLISTQKPRAEVYAAMAESLGLAWKDLNLQLEQRKTILTLNTELHRDLDECSDHIVEVENSSFENPETIEGCQELISRSKVLRKAMLSSFLVCLEEGQVLIDKLEEQKVIDSRPDHGVVQAQFSISQVQRWLEKLHDRRGILEERFKTKHEKLNEQLIYLKIQIEMGKIKNGVHENSLISQDYGSDVKSVQDLDTGINNQVQNITEFREKMIQVAKTLEGTRFRHLHGAKLKNESFQIIDACNQIISLAEEMRYKLSLSLEFFKIVQEAEDKLDKIGPEQSEDTVRRVNEITATPLNKGQVLLNSWGWDNSSTKGVRSAYDKLLGKKNALIEAEDVIYKTAILNDFLQDYNNLYSYLIAVDAFLKSEEHLQLGPDLEPAESLRDTLMSQLTELDSKQMVFDLDEEIKSDDLEEKVSTLNAFMKRLVNMSEGRLALTEYFIEILNQAALIEHQLSEDEEDETTSRSGRSSSIATTIVHSTSQVPQKGKGKEQHIRSSSSSSSSASLKGVPRSNKISKDTTTLEDKLIKLEDFGAGFLEACSEAEKIDSAFRTEPACLKIKEILSNIQTRLDKAALAKKQAADAEEMNREISKAMDRLTDLISSSFPILPESPQESPTFSSPRPIVKLSSSSSPTPTPARQYKGRDDAVLTHIESTLIRVLTQVGQLEHEFDALLEKEKGQVEDDILKSGQNQLKSFAINYKLLSLNFTTFFKNLHEVDVLIEDETERNPMATESTNYEEVDEILKICREHANEIVINIREMEPEDTGNIDEARLLAAIEEKRLEWDEAMRRKAKAIAAKDLQQIEKQLSDLRKHLELTRGQYGESLIAARECSASFAAFEETIEILGVKIDKFIQTVDEDMKGKVATLKENWAAFLQMTRERRRLIDLSLQYFTLVNEAETWFKDGSKLLITIARKSASVKTPEEADELLTELEAFIKPGEVKQDERIGKISQLASQLYGEEKRKLYDALMVKENREMIDSLTSMNNELSVLAENLRYKHALSVPDDNVIVKVISPVATIKVQDNQDTETEAGPPVSEMVSSVSSSTSTTTASVSTSTWTETQQLTTPLNNAYHRPITPTMVEKETQFEVVTADNVVPKTERDTVTQTVDEIQFEKETQTDIEEEIKPAPILIPPSFSSPLQDIAINEGEKLRFQCIVAGTPEPSITWLKDGLLVTSSNLDYKTEIKNGICSLTIDETFADDSSIFTCRAVNDAGTADTSAKLLVKESQDSMLSPPKFEMPLPQSTKLIEGTVNHQLSCLVKGNPLPTVEWFKNNDNIDTAAEFIITFNNGLCILKFGEVILEDEGMYTCRATNKAGEAESSSELLVEARSIAFLEPLSKKTMARTGQKLKLECRTNVPCDFQWLHDGKAVKENIKSDPISSVLLIEEAYAKDSGHYVVTARNPRLGENKCSCHVVVKGRLPNETSDSEIHSDMEPVKPKIKMALEDTDAKEGDKIRLDCVIVGQPEPEVIWYHDGKPVKESKDFQLIFRGDKCSLIIKEAFLEDSGTYRVSAVNSAGEANSTCKLSVLALEELSKGTQSEPSDVPVAPKFSKLIEDTMVNENEEVALSCAVSEGSPVPTIKWYKNAVEITAQPGYSISSSGNDHELKILKALPEHRGNYMVKASNILGEVKCFGCLIVKGPLSLESPSAVRKTDEVVSSTKEPTEITETSIHTSATTQQLSMQQNTVDTNEFSQQLESVSVQDRAAFFKSKESPSKSSSSNIPLLIRPRSHVAPRFVSPINGIMADEGSMVVLEGQIDGSPDPTIKWTRNDLDFDFEPLTKFSHGKVTLELRNIQISDGGRYACQASNDAGIATSVADVVVRKNTFPPVFGKRLQAQTVQRNKRIYMEVEVIGTPTPSIMWFKDGVPVDTKNPEYQFRAEGNRHILVVPNATSDKSGQYMVKASNEAGNAQSIADVVVLGDQRRSSPARGVTIFESTVGISDELGAPKPVTLIYETRSSTSQVSKTHSDQSSINKSSIRSISSPTPKHVPIILKTQPTLPSADSWEHTDPIPRPVLESPRVMSPVGKPVAVKVESITVTSEPFKDQHKSKSSEISTATTITDGTPKKIIKEITSTYVEKSTAIFKSTPAFSPITSPTPLSKMQGISTSTTSETKIGNISQTSSETEARTTPTVQNIPILPPPAPCSTPEPPLKPSTAYIPSKLPEHILKFMEAPQTENVSNQVKSIIDTSSAGIISSRGDGIPFQPPKTQIPVAVKPVQAQSPSNVPTPAPTQFVTSYSIKKDAAPLVVDIRTTTTTSSELIMSQSQTTSNFLPELIPGPPPEICYSPKPEEFPKKFHVSEKVKFLEEHQRKMSIPDIAGAVRILPPEPSPPVVPPKETPVLLRKTLAPTPPPKPKSVSVTPEPPSLIESFPALEPFPFKPDGGMSKSKVKPPPPPKPKKFVAAEFRESDYESDFEGKIPPKWQPATSAFVTVAPQTASVPPVPTTSFAPHPTTSVSPLPQIPPSVPVPTVTSFPPPTSVLQEQTTESSLPPQYSVKNLVKSWPPAESFEDEILKEQIDTTRIATTVTEDVSRRSIRDDVSFFEGIVPAPATEIPGRITPSVEALSMDKIWARPLAKSKIWPPVSPSPTIDASAPAPTPSAPVIPPKPTTKPVKIAPPVATNVTPAVPAATPTIEPVNYYISTVSTPRSTPINNVEEMYQHQQSSSTTTTTSSTSRQSSSYQFEQKTLQISDDAAKRGPSPTVITDRGVKPSDSKKGWPPSFVPNNSPPFKQVQPSWMQPKGKSSTVSGSGGTGGAPFSSLPESTVCVLPKPGTPPEIGFAPFPNSISGLGSSQLNSQSMFTSSSSSSTMYESTNKTLEEGTGYSGSPMKVHQSGTIFHIMKDLQLDPPYPTAQQWHQRQQQQQHHQHQQQPSLPLQHQEAGQPRVIPDIKISSDRDRDADRNIQYRENRTTTSSKYEHMEEIHQHQPQILSQSHFQSQSHQQGMGSSGVGVGDGSGSNSSTTMAQCFTGKNVPRIIPSKFVKGDFYESDYASDIEEARIKPKWAPVAESDTDSEPVYRPIQPQLKWKKCHNRAATEALESLGQSFVQKAGSVAEKFSNEMVQPTSYSHEERNIQTGESQDPGLIYFKYDFGYEFGVVMPKEDHSAVEGRPSSGLSRNKDDISLPILHETTAKKH